MRILKLSPIVRAVGVIGGVAALVTGVTFASLNSTATLTDNTINSATADLTIFNGSGFVSSAQGFTVTDLVPGTGKTYPLYLKNGGAMDLNIVAKVATPPTLAGFDNNLDYSKVMVVFHNEFTNTDSSVTLNDLVQPAGVTFPGNPLHAGAQANSAVAGTEGNYTVHFDFDKNSVNGSSASVSAFNMTLTGTQI